MSGGGAGGASGIVWSGMPAAVAAGLAARLSTPFRTYHNRMHVERMIGDGTPCADLVSPDGRCGKLGYAIAYHDAVIVGHGGGASEEASARLFEDHFDALARHNPCVRRSWLGEVATAIRATASHAGRPEGLSAWQHELLDLDLGGLGLSPASFREDFRSIEREWTATGGDRDAYRAGAVSFLTGLAKERRIYRETLQEREVRARSNIGRLADWIGDGTIDRPEARP